MAITVKQVGVTFIVSVVLLLVYTIYHSDNDQLNNLVQSQSKTLRLYNELKNDIDDIVGRQQRDEKLRSASAEAFVKLRSEVASLSEKVDSALQRVDSLTDTVEESTSRLQTLADSVLETSDHFDEVKLEFSALKHSTNTGTKQMVDAESRIKSQVVGIGERVQSWERSLELLRNTVESMEAAFKRVQLQFLSADSMGMGSGLAGTTQADDEYRANNPNHAQLYSQPQVRRVSQPNLQYVPPGAFETSGDESPYDPEAALAAQKALEEHGRRVIEQDRQRRAAEQAKAEKHNEKQQYEAETGRRDISDVHLVSRDHERLKGRASELAHVRPADDEPQPLAPHDPVAHSNALFDNIAGVTLLNDDSFELRTSGAAHLVALVSAASPRSAALLARWADLSERLRRIGVRTAVVDGAASPRTKERFHVDGYPALFVLAADGESTPFTGSRTDDNIVAFVKQALDLA